MESTTPVAAPAKATSGRDFDPISSSCRNNSRNSNGGVTAARTTRQKNIPRSPNHSRKLPIGPGVETEVGTVDDAGAVDEPGGRAAAFAGALSARSIMGLNLSLNQGWSPGWAPDE